MPASVCPQCGRSYTVAQAHLGRTVRCEGCGGEFVLGGALASAQPAVQADFDAYHQWLGIPPEEQPPHHYRLLGVKLFEDNPSVIENAADRQMAHLRTFQTGKRAALSQRLLSEVAVAKLCLLKAEKKAAYDAQLRRTLAAAGPERPMPVAPPPPPPARQAKPAKEIVSTQEFATSQPATALATPPPAHDPLLLQQLGEYKLIEKLGEGGMGAVYKARHTKLNRNVALKILAKTREDDADAVARFEREMQASGALEHPNIVVTHDAREIDGRRFLVMELLEGLDLEQVIRRCQPLSVAEACELIRQAALGLQYAHERGLVHRDIKPSNLMLTRQGQVKILDLGLAKLHTDQRKPEELTAADTALGTLNYMAPEQIREVHNVDIRADIYSLGCTLYKLLVGHAPFSCAPDAPAFEVMQGHLEKPPPPLRKLRGDIPAEVEATVNRMLAKDPARRFQTPADVADALGPFAATADLAAILARAKQAPSTLQSSPYHDTHSSSLVSSATQFFNSLLKVGAVGLVRKREPAPAKPKRSLAWTLGGIAAVLLVASGLLAWSLMHGGKTDVAKVQAPATAKPIAQSPSRLSKADSDDEPLVKPKVSATPESPAAIASATPPKPADGKLAVTLPQDQRKGAKLEIDGKAQDIPAGSDPIEVALAPGEHSLRIERLGYQPYAWKGEIEAAKTQTAVPKWEAIVAAKPPESPTPAAVATLPQLTEALKKALGDLDAADAHFNGELEPAERLIAAWDFRGAAEALAKVHFDKPNLADRLESRRDEVKRLAALKTRLIEKIAAADPRLQKRQISLRGLGGEVTATDESGITATLASEKTEVHRWAEYGDEVAQKATHKPVQDLLRLVIDRDKADDWLVAGLLALVCRDVPFAERCFEKAGSLGAKIDAQLAPLAEAAFRAGVRLLGEKHSKEADAALAHLEEKYKEISWFVSHKPAVDAARALAKRRVMEAEAEGLYAQAVVYFKEKELHDVKAIVDQLRADYPGMKPLIDPDRKPSLSELEVAVAGLVRLTVRLDGKGDFKSIQEAIDAAKPGTLIEIQDNGPYKEMLTIPGGKKSLTIRGMKGCWPVIMSAGCSARIGTLVTIDADRTRLERLILLHNAPAGDRPCCIACGSGGISLRSTLVFMPLERGSGLTTGVGHNGCIAWENCLILANVKAKGWAEENSRLILNNCLVSGETKIIRPTSARLQFCILSKVYCEAEPIEILDSIVKDTQEASPAKRIANCDFLGDSTPSDGAKCLRMDPQFRDPKNLDFRLMPTSPCRKRASDDGDIGCRYTPEMLELCKRAVELAQRHFIKF